ncbi:MAG: vitamin B12-dependent ribonucleotide reductase [Planctomycetota bacterium]
MPARRPRARRRTPSRGPGLAVPRVFSVAGSDPYAAVAWRRRTARIEDAEGRVLFEQRGVEAPSTWSDQAVDLVASRYFAGRLGTAARERSVRALVGRVVGTVAGWVRAGGVLGGAGDAAAFEDELAALLLQQRASFNSPVWFNVGVEAQPQCSACFILGVEDHLPSILELATVEGRVFSRGSGAGSNFSALRASNEPTRTGGLAAGPVAFLRGLDALAGAVKSGGRTRRAAKMAILDADHPDVLAFVESKAIEEARARVLAAAGLDRLDGAHGPSVAFQNENHSVRLPDAFLRAVARDGAWTLRPRTAAGRPTRIRARDLLRAAARAAHDCGDPGVQFADTIERWNPVPVTGPIRATNPCAEFVFLDDTACNLASINVLAFRDPVRGVDVERLAAAVRVLVVAMETLVGHASYPTPRIAERSARLRPLGLGVTNLGALLLSLGLPYDGDAGRALAAGVMALVGGEATRTSARLAARLGPFDAWAANRAPALRVLARHVRAAHRLDRRLVPAALRAAAVEAWDDAAARAAAVGLRNAQVTAIAPTGTISFLMDCDTTGVEPALALAQEKSLTEGGVLRLALRCLPTALDALGYDAAAAAAVLAHVDATGGVDGAPGLAPGHAEVFRTALPTRPGGPALPPRAHLAMMAALQPFVSGAISKTVNLPADATVEDVEATFLEAFRLGLKAVAVYRDRSKVTQPLAPASPPVCTASSGCD